MNIRPDVAVGIHTLGRREQQLLGSLPAFMGGWGAFGVESGQHMKLTKKHWLVKSSKGLTSHLIQKPGILHDGQHFNGIKRPKYKDPK